MPKKKSSSISRRRDGICNWSEGKEEEKQNFFHLVELDVGHERIKVYRELLPAKTMRKSAQKAFQEEKERVLR